MFKTIKKGQIEALRYALILVLLNKDKLEKT